jgi:hypothetical protein
MAITIGIVVVACWAARMPAAVPDTMRSTGKLTRSAVRAGNRSTCPSAHRSSIPMVCPST